MSDIFLSYKSEDRAKAQIIAEALERNGYSVWWDRIIPPGRNFDDVIEDELNKAKCVVVLWSEKSIKAKWVKTEASEGDRRGILVPIKIEDVTPPLAFRMMQAARLMDWDGISHHHEFDLLIQSVERIFGQPVPMDSEVLLEFVAEKASQIKVPEKPDKPKPEEISENISNSIGMIFAHIPAGKFNMGSQPSERDRFGDEGPVHKVTIRNPFYFGVYPVTQNEWQAVMGNNPSFFKGDKLPVERVSWDDVQNFITKLNEKEGSDKYRLPSEAEWEYAARANTITHYSFGDNKSELGEYGWYDENSNNETHPVGKKKSNPWGLYDMHGNVWEWVQDEWHNSYEGTPSDGSAWEDGSGAFRVLRGGGWNSGARYCRSAARDDYPPGYRFDYFGFRLLKEL